jgi:hypothetical protein
LQNILLEVRKELKELTEVKDLKDLKDLKDSLNNLKQNPVPIGFIYVQLPSQSDPRTLWSTVEWTEVSSDYAGNFFRVVGGNAGTFGSIQEENTLRITHIQSSPYGPYGSYSNSTVISPGKTSEWTYSGQQCISGICTLLAFTTSTGEVRPRNQAMRIWKRTK